MPIRVHGFARSDVRRHRPRATTRYGPQACASSPQRHDRLAIGLLICSPWPGRERERDSTNALTRALDALIDKTMRMPMPVKMVVIVLVLLMRIVVSATHGRRETNPAKDMAMAPHMRMGMHQTTVPMFKKIAHRTTPHPTRVNNNRDTAATRRLATISGLPPRRRLTPAKSRFPRTTTGSRWCVGVTSPNPGAPKTPANGAFWCVMVSAP
jgi:hypothetical protein